MPRHIYLPASARLDKPACLPQSFASPCLYAPACLPVLASLLMFVWQHLTACFLGLTSPSRAWMAGLYSLHLATPACLSACLPVLAFPHVSACLALHCLTTPSCLPGLTSRTCLPAYFTTPRLAAAARQSARCACLLAHLASPQCACMTACLPSPHTPACLPACLTSLQLTSQRRAGMPCCTRLPASQPAWPGLASPSLPAWHCIAAPAWPC
jgi:hypothetical protein